MPTRSLRASWRPTATALLLVATVLLPATPVLAQAATARQAPMSLVEEVVVTASVAPVEFDALTRAVHAVFGRELERLGVTTAADGLRLVAGVDVRARGPRDVQTDFAIRGATFGQSLVLVDGLRLNDSQSGHHNGDVPVPVVGIERIEVLSGAGSAVHGADALGGTINVISRVGSHATFGVSAGQHGYAAVDASASGNWLPDTWMVTGWASRSSGFMFDRDFALGGALARGRLSPGVTLDVRHLRKAFGANGFYGNSPSREWTDLTLAGLSWQDEAAGWTMAARGLFRNHGDHFRWDVHRPGFAENRHRTNAGSGTITAARPVGSRHRLTVGGTGGADFIRSSNLGDHVYGHGAGFAELQTTLGDRAAVQTGLRFDRYSTFGGAWSPSVSAGVWLAPAVRLRASVARAFRIPTYTERYYTDPAHQASSTLAPERGWSFDAGADWDTARWLVSLSGFRRWDEGVIDWVKSQPTERWRTTNVRDVTTSGVEVSAGRSWSGAFVRLTASALHVDAPTLTLLSKYVLEYTRHAIGLAASGTLAGGLSVSGTVDMRRRYGAGAYAVVTLRAARAFGRSSVFLDVANAFDEEYVEIPGVAMPGRWLTVGVRVK